LKISHTIREARRDIERALGEAHYRYLGTTVDVRKGRAVTLFSHYATPGFDVDAALQFLRDRRAYGQVTLDTKGNVFIRFSFKLNTV
jgi:hypothetical protein